MVFKRNLMKRKSKAEHLHTAKGRVMPALLDAPEASDCGNQVDRLDEKTLDNLVVAMGKRLQAEYIEGAIPYLKGREPELWARLEMLDQEKSLEALLEYERLFFEGLHRYVCSLEGKRQAA
jgi:hypothetical protein